jgi:hypothetical protein
VSPQPSATWLLSGSWLLQGLLWQMAAQRPASLKRVAVGVVRQTGRTPLAASARVLSTMSVRRQ